jgi:opacity protein-like surface antigen
MRNFCLAVFILSLLCSSAEAQDAFKKPRKSFYVFAGPGRIAANTSDSSSSFQFGFGFEGFVYRGLGLGIEGGTLRDSHNQTWSATMYMNVIYDFQRSAKQKLSPFVAFGPSFLQGYNVCCGMHFGGGIKYSMGKHYGVRAEFRDHVRGGGTHNTYNDPQFLFGLSIR